MALSTFALLSIAFYGLLGVSAVLAALLLVIFRGKRDLLLLRAGCFVVLLMTLGMALWPAYHRGAVDDTLLDSWACRGQALVLHYVFVFLHVLAALIMLDNCYQSLDYRWWVFAAGRLDRVTTLFCVALLVPLLPIGLVLFENSGGRQVIYPGAYFCYVRPFPLPASLWYAACFAVGTYYSGRLFYKTLFRRARSVARFEQVTVFTRRYMVLLFARLLFYCLLAGGTSLPFVLRWRKLADTAPILEQPSTLPLHERSPWTSTCDMCRWGFVAPAGLADAEHFAELLCPTLMDFVPSVIGIFFFVLYGLGAAAQQGYRAMWARIRPARHVARSRRESALPLVGEALPGDAGFRTPSPVDEEEAGGTYDDGDGASSARSVVAVEPVAAPVSPAWLRDDCSSGSVPFDDTLFFEDGEYPAAGVSQEATPPYSDECGSDSSASYGSPPFVAWDRQSSSAEDL